MTQWAADHAAMTRPRDYLVVLDFEATCDDTRPPSPQEIIEFPSVLLSAHTLDVVAEFESFVRPTHHPVLTPFCTELTGIHQGDVDGAPAFVDVFAAHQAWLLAHGLPRVPTQQGLPYAFVTCGHWDLKTVLPAQLRAVGLDPHGVPLAYRRWINIKHPFRATMKEKRGPAGMPHMLTKLGLSLEGRHHRGIDDCRNIARLVRALAQQGSTFEITGALPALAPV